MKKHFLSLPYVALFSMFILFSFSSCEKMLPQSYTFDMDDMSYTFTLPAADTTGQLVVSTEMSMDTDSAMAAQGIDNYEVSSIKIKSANLSTTTSGANFNSFGSFGAYIATPTKTETMIGENNAVPKDVQQVNLTVKSDINLVEYVKEKPTTFTLKGNVVSPLQD
ncbi:MAG: hypothetical protein ACXWEY_09735, partial [Bacteroidia bacterium]